MAEARGCVTEAKMGGAALRVMTYNLLYGGHEREGDAWVYHPERFEAACAVIRAEAPAVLGLTEAVYCDARGRTLRQDFGRLFGMQYLYAEGAPGDWTNCLLSRYPLSKTRRFALGVSPSGVEQSGLRATLDCYGVEVTVDLVHPSPNIWERERVAAFAPLFEGLSARHVMLGDFNALSDEDPYDRDVLVRELTGNVRDPDTLAARMLDRQLLAAARGCGLRDAMAPEARGPTLPTALHRPHATQGARLRIDYVLVSDAVRVEGARVVRGELADRASDHYPVVADLLL